jgi:hypothetical protein
MPVNFFAGATKASCNLSCLCYTTFIKRGRLTAAIVSPRFYFISAPPYAMLLEQFIIAALGVLNYIGFR